LTTTLPRARIRFIPRSVRLRGSLLSLSAATFGCAVGPDFQPPEPPAVTRYPATPIAAETVSADAPAGLVQRFTSERDIPAEWWTLFECPALDALVRQALQDSPRLAQVQAKLVHAEEEFGGRKGATRYPQIDASVSGNRINVDSDAFKSPALAPDFPLTLSLASVSVSYTLDIFGRNRRELEGLQSAVDYEQFELEAARLMIAGNVVTAAIEEASLREQIAQTEAAVDIATRQFKIIEGLERLGAVPPLDVVIQSGELARTRSKLPALHQRLEQTRHRLAVYLGQPPAAAQLPEFRLADLRLPAELPLSVPSDLARQRPDIRAAEALLHEASARVGVATASLYPRFTLSAQGGALALSPLLSGTTGFALLGASIAQPLFHAGELKAQKRSAVAAFDQAGAAYREVVLSGLQNVADTMVALDADAKILRERAEVAKLAETAYGVTSKQYEAGGVSLLALLDAERQRATAAVEETQAIRDRFADTAALFQALGGGWWTANASENGE
jgi:NodT family efflux transporter outer membrane factor (OMF) lipoprotein